MKKILLAALYSLLYTGSYAQTTAPNWTAVDCNSVSHTLYDDLDDGKVVVMVWVMPCSYCSAGSKIAYNTVSQYVSTHPGKVIMYLVDDFGDQDCSTINQWVADSSIGTGITTFSNANNTIDQDNYGGAGMPHIAVIGPDRYIYFNKWNGYAEDPDGIKGAIDFAIAVSLGVDDKALSQDIIVTPNPAHDKLNISTVKPVKEIWLYTVTGQLAMHQSLAVLSTDIKLDISGLAPGSYIIRLADASGNITNTVRNIVKQ